MPAIAIPIAMAAASAASSYAASRAQGRKDQFAANQQQDQLRLAAQREGMSNPRTAMQDMIRAQLLGMAPTAGMVGSGQGVPQTPGGVVGMPQTQAPEMGLLQQAMQRNALMQGMKGYAPSITPTPQPQATGLDKVLGVIGAVGTGASNAYLGGQNIAALYPNLYKTKAPTPVVGAGGDPW